MIACRHIGLLYQGSHWLECCDCGEWLSLGQSNDDIPEREMTLAEILAEVPTLWEPGDWPRVIELQVDYCAGLP